MPYKDLEEKRKHDKAYGKIYRQQHPEKRNKEHRATWLRNYRKTPEVKKKQKLLSKAWYVKNKQTHKVTTANYYKNHNIHLYRVHKQWTKEHPKKLYEYNKKNRKNHPEIYRIYGLIHLHPEDYPLDDKCIFCGEPTKLEHGHLDYEDSGNNYVTVCHKCNYWMGRRT
jgi:hypothetical protein